MEIKNNFLSETQMIMLENNIGSDEFPWYFNNNVVDDIEPNEKFQFTHTFYRNAQVVSDWYRHVTPILEILKPIALIRIKANLQPFSFKTVKQTPHIDFKSSNDTNVTTAIFYVNTNNGYTYFMDGTEIKSERNKLIMFDSKKLHAGTTCTDQKRRMVINFNYIK